RARPDGRRRPRRRDGSTLHPAGDRDRRQARRRRAGRRRRHPRARPRADVGRRRRGHALHPRRRPRPGPAPRPGRHPRGDLALLHRRPRRRGPVMTSMSALHRDGYLILPGLLTPPACRGIRDDLTPLLAPAGRDPFRSRHVRRVYGVLHNTRATDTLIDHPRVLALVDRLLLPNFLLSQLEVVEVGAGAPARPPAHDDQHYPLPRPRPALSVAALWTLD